MLVAKRKNKIQRVQKSLQRFFSELHIWYGNWDVSPWPPSTNTEQWADEMFRVLEMLPGHGGGTCLWVSFSTWKICHSLSAHVSYHVKFVLSVPSGNRLEGLGSLWWSYLPPAVHVHVHFSTLFLYACCTVLCLSLGARTRTFVPEKCCLTSMWSLSPATSCSFLQC